MKTYNFNKELSVLETSVEGILIIDDIIDHYKRLSKDETLSPKTKVVINCSKAIFKVKIEDLRMVHESLKCAVNRFDELKEAIVVDKPFETAVATLFKMIAIYKNHEFKIFSTSSAAYKWLD